jgi:hypothetical protein
VPNVASVFGLPFLLWFCYKQTKPQQKGQSKDSGNTGHKTHKQTKPQQKAKKDEQPYQKNS